MSPVRSISWVSIVNATVKGGHAPHAPAHLARRSRRATPRRQIAGLPLALFPARTRTGRRCSSSFEYRDTIRLPPGQFRVLAVATQAGSWPPRSHEEDSAAIKWIVPQSSACDTAYFHPYHRSEAALMPSTALGGVLSRLRPEVATSARRPFRTTRCDPSAPQLLQHGMP